ncbi:hypothetical protein LINPERPRIM_LOCUS42919 [Linum perenne]
MKLAEELGAWRFFVFAMQLTVIREMRFDDRKASDLPELDRMQLIHKDVLRKHLEFGLCSTYLFRVAIRLKVARNLISLQLDRNAVDELFVDKGVGGTNKTLVLTACALFSTKAAAPSTT